jgi:AcrR family transcriptional regulator
MTPRDETRDAARRHLNEDPTLSLGDLAARMGIARATLHRHFSTREALLTEIGRASLDSWEASQRRCEQQAAIDSGDPGRLRACVEAHLRDCVVDAEEFGFALTDHFLSHSAELVERAAALERLDVALYAAAQQAGVLRPDLPAAWLSHAVWGLMLGSRNALRGGDVARRQLEDIVVSTFLDGAAAR